MLIAQDTLRLEDNMAVEGGKRTSAMMRTSRRTPHHESKQHRTCCEGTRVQGNAASLSDGCRYDKVTILSWLGLRTRCQKLYGGRLR